MTVITVPFETKDYARIVRIAGQKKMKLATFLRRLTLDSLKDKEYISSIEIPEFSPYELARMKRMK